jgi:hypothetical protein
VNLRSNNITEPLPNSIHYWIESLDLSFNKISSCQRRTNTPNNYLAPFQAPLIYFTSRIGNQTILLQSRVVNLVGNDLDSTVLYLGETDRPDFAVPVSIYPQLRDYCGEDGESWIVSPTFRNEVWKDVLLDIRAFKTYEQMCGGSNCTQGVRQKTNTKYPFCLPITDTHCSYPCVKDISDNATIFHSSEKILKWYDLFDALNHFYVIVSHCRFTPVYFV